MRRRKKIVIAISILLGISVYFYVMIVCLLHESSQETIVASQKQQAKPTVQEEMTPPEKPEEKSKLSQPSESVLPQRTRTSIPRQTQISLIGREAPDFNLLDLDDRRIKLSYFKGKLIILDFWATWCGPCVKEIPHFIDLYEKYADQGLVVLGVSVDRKGINIVDSFVKRHKVNYQILMADAQVKAAYGGIRNIPTTFVIDKESKIQRCYVGYRDKAVFEADIKALLVSDETLITDLKSDDPSVQLDAVEGLIARGSFPESEVFLRFCSDVAETASQNLDMAGRVHRVVVQYLSHTRLSEEELDCLKDLPSPHGLKFDKMHITDAGMSYLGRLSSIHLLHLEGTKITNMGLIYLNNLHSLKILFIGGTKVTDAGLLHFKNLIELERFCVHYTQVTSEGLSHLKDLTRLKYLCVHDTQVGDSGLEYLKDLTSLETLLLHNTCVTDQGLTHLKGLNSLKRLTLAGTRVTSQGVDKLKQTLPSCNISGPHKTK